MALLIHYISWTREKTWIDTILKALEDEKYQLEAASKDSRNGQITTHF